MKTKLVFLILWVISFKNYAQNTYSTIAVGYLQNQPQIQLNPGNWHYIAVTKSGLNGNVYIDGILASSSIYSNVPYMWNSLLLGATQGCVSCSPVPTYLGQIDEVRISNTVRTASEIQDNYNSNTPFTLDSNTLGLFHFDSDTGTTITNSVGGNNGVLYGGVSFDAGKFGLGLSFDGIDDYSRISQSIPVNNMTIEFWYKSSDNDAVLAMMEYAYNTGIYLGTQSISCEVPSGTLANGLVAYYPFCGNANDASGNANDGTVNGATLTTDRYGNANSAYSFNGSSNYIQVPNSLTLQNISEISISAWVNINQLYQSGGAGFFPILSKSDSQSTYGSFAFGFWNPNITAYLNNHETAYAFPFSFGTWQHVVVTISNNTTSFYLNGNLLWSGNSGVFPNNYFNDLPLIIGMDKPGLIEYANGKIDDIGIWNRVLNSQEVMTLYNGNNCLTIAPTGSSNQTLCANSTFSDLQVTGTNIQYYDSSTGGNLITSNTILTNGQVVYASQTVNSCESNDRLAITITVNDLQINATSTNVCLGTSVTLTASNSPNVIQNCTLPTNLQNGLVGYWPFCGDANDNSGNGNNGTVYGATLTTDRFGNSNSAYSFNGTSNYIIIQNNLIPNQQSYTINLWTKLEANQVVDLFNDRQEPNCYYKYRVLIVNGVIQFWKYSNSSLEKVVGNTLPLNQWVMITAVFDNNLNNIKIYVNSSLNSSSSSNNWNVSQNSTTIGGLRGCNTNGTFNFQSGPIDDSGIWNRALSQSEIQQLYNQGQTTYLWSTGETTSTINPSPNITTTYWCNVTVNGVTCRKEITITVNNPITPSFNQIASICSGSSLNSIPTTSTDSITGVWSPSLDNTTTTTYTFTPDSGQCATTATMTIIVNPNQTPTFNQVSPICNGATLNALPATSVENVIGTWTPAVDNTTTTTYTFIPDSGQCAISAQMTIVVNPNITPTFNQIPPICYGNNIQVLPNTSLEGISGLWSPIIDNTATTTYTFTPNNTGQCINLEQMTIVVNQLPSTPLGSSNQSYNNGETLNNLVVSGTNLVWYDSDTSTNPLDNSTLLVNGTTYYVCQSSNGCEGSRLAITVTMTLGINENHIFNLSYNPNPVDDLLYIKANDIIERVSVYNLLGQLLINEVKDSNEFSINLSNLPASNYFVKVETESKGEVFKVIKK